VTDCVIYLYCSIAILYCTPHMRFLFQSYSIDITMKIYHGWPALMGLGPYW